MIKQNKKSDKRVLIASESQAFHSTKRLMSESIKLNYPTLWLNPYEQTLEIKKKLSPNKNGTYFHRTSGTRYDEFDLLVSSYYEQSGLSVSNPLSALKVFRQKDLQSLFFMSHNISSVETIVYRGELTSKTLESIKKLSSNEKFILKMVRGNQGIGVNLIESFQSLKSILETFHALRDQKFLIQPFIEHKREWRVFILKNEILGSIERTLSKDDFRGNSKRSTGKFIKKLPVSAQEALQKAFHQSGLDYCGIDIMETEKGITFLEMNSVPGFEQLEELSKKNIAKELIVGLT